MIKYKTAGIFVLRKDGQVLICHPTNHPSDVWSIPKGRIEPNETLLDAALRETLEETGLDLKLFNNFKITYLGDAIYKNNKKQIFGFLFEEHANSDFDWSSVTLHCDSLVPLEMGGFPEMDDYKWCDLDTAKDLVHVTQGVLIDNIKQILKVNV